MTRILMALVLFSSSQGFSNENRIQRFLFIGGTDPQTLSRKINAQVDGVQIVYTWKSLERNKGQYTLDEIERDLAFLNSRGKRLWIQLQDRFFGPKDRSVPDYLLSEAVYQGGLAKQKDNPGENKAVGSGWVSKQWNPKVRDRFQKLISQIAQKFDGRVYGINLPETSADIDLKAESRNGFSCDQYFAATVENINFTRSVFKKSHVVQYINFWPCEWDNDHHYMSRFFQNASDKKIGLGGPDILPYRKGQMKNSYPFFHEYNGKLPIVAFAVQEPTRTYANPKTGKKFTEEEFLEFARDYLGADLIFWSTNK